MITMIIDIVGMAGSGFNNYVVINTTGNATINYCCLSL